MKLNLPNRLTMLRIALSPVFMAFLVLRWPSPVWSLLIGAALFIAASITDLLDGRIARSRNMITDLGKFLDPMADKLMIFAAMLAILVRCSLEGEELFAMVYIWAAFAVVLRELAVTSMRMVAASRQGLVIAAANLGKIKTVTQIVNVCCVLLEPVLLGLIWPPLIPLRPLGYLSTAVMVFFTIWSGIDYLKSYWKVIAA